MGRHHQDQLACLTDQAQIQDEEVMKEIKEDEAYIAKHPDLYWRCGICGELVSVDGGADDPCLCDDSERAEEMENYYWRGEECD